jgi:4-aminobutyrate aminotransferase-like enzyme/Ser/Thr protein kinase RdoA (MazF antagonist)
MNVTVENRPRLPAELAADLVRENYRLTGSISPLPAEWDQNFRLDCGESGIFVVKIANRGIGDDLLDFQNAAMDRLNGSWTGAACPRVIRSRTGQTICTVTDDHGDRLRLRVLSFLEGTPLARIGRRDRGLLDHLGFALGGLDACLRDFIHPAMDREMRWDLRRCDWIGAGAGRIPDIRRRAIVESILLQFRARVGPLAGDLPMSVIHNDANDENVLVAPGPDGEMRITGLLDFGDMLLSHTVNEVAVACAYAVLGSDDPVPAAAGLVGGYHRARPLGEAEWRVVFPLILMRLCVSVTTSAIAAAEDPGNPHRQISDRAAWEMLERLAPLEWDEVETRFRRDAGFPSRSTAFPTRPAAHGGDSLLEARRARLGPSLSLSYRRPLEIVRGRGQFLFDRGGRAYLDCVNNVCHVGHSHPKVVAALAGQAAILNTNTRYLHPAVVEYARRLTATMPEPLRVCYFVNSGSEANELAVRIARAVTGRRDVIVVEGGYHGSTGTLVELSPYKSEGPGGPGLPAWVHKVAKPDPFRGPHRGNDAATGSAYAGLVGDACGRLKREGRPPALFLCEPVLGCGGQIVPPDGYLREAFTHVRAAGGLCIADEVQVGFGRVGSHMWAFETQGVVPDIVTLGKPIGNGHPIGAVVTTAEIAAAFANGMEFFSTFGGNPVSAAVGLAVLDVLEEEGLRQHAGRVGEDLKAGFRDLATSHPEIGDVRGLGMFLGVELVRDPETLEPATQETGDLIERVLADGILLSAEGPHRNILKIKPPLRFDTTDATLLLGAVDRALHAIFRT